MSARLLNSLRDENPDLQKHFGCMNRIFQIFDCRNFINSRRIDNDNSTRFSSSGENGISRSTEPTSAGQKSRGRSPKNPTKEKQKFSSESSRISFSSSSSSCSTSVSSIDKTAQLEPSLFSQSVFPGTPIPEFPKNQTNNSLHLKKQPPLDLHDVVKNSMYSKNQSLSVKTAVREKVVSHTLKHIDSPRPTQPHKYVDPSISGLKEAPRNINVVEKDGHRKIFRRLSFDEREIESRDKFKSKFKELKRLSLDSREGYQTGLRTRSNSLLEESQWGARNCSQLLINHNEEPGSSKRPSTVVAKLMGLEDFPDSTSKDEKLDPFSRSARTTDEGKQNRFSRSPRISHKDPISPCLKDTDLLMKPKPMLSSNFPTETDPRRQQYSNREAQVPAVKSPEVAKESSSSSYSVYGEIEKRLATLEFKKSGKDLRALKQILEAMQKTKIMPLDKTDHGPDMTSKTSNNSILDQNNTISAAAKVNNSPKKYKSPIVIMKPSRLVEKDNDPVTTPLSSHNISGLHKLGTAPSACNRKEPIKKQMTKDLSRSPSHQLPVSKDKKTNTRISSKSSGSMSPRLLQNYELYTDPLSDSSRSNRKCSVQKLESGSVGIKLGPKSPNLHQKSNSQSRKISCDVRDLRYHGITHSLQSESNSSSGSHTDIEVQSNRFNTTKSSSRFPQDGCIQNNPAAVLGESQSTAGLAIARSEEPSPISVLDSTFYGDESPSPVKKICYAFEDDETLYPDEEEGNPVLLAQLANSTKPLNSGINNKKSENIQQLENNIEPVNCSHQDPFIDCIAPLYESKNQNQRYISEILLASDLFSNPDCGLSITQRHSTSHLIDPNLFLVLEKTKARWSSIDEQVGNMTTKPEPNKKTHREPEIDTFNEILAGKLVAGSSFKELLLPCDIEERKPIKQQLLRELCSKVDDKLQCTKKNGSLDSEENTSRSMLLEDLMQQSKSWADYHNEIAGVVLNVEQLIFKDLITEVIWS